MKKILLGLGLLGVVGLAQANTGTLTANWTLYTDTANTPYVAANYTVIISCSTPSVPAAAAATVAATLTTLSTPVTYAAGELVTCTMQAKNTVTGKTAAASLPATAQTSSPNPSPVTGLSILIQ